MFLNNEDCMIGSGYNVVGKNKYSKNNKYTASENKKLCIIGYNIDSLYIGIKAIEKGYEPIIFEKKEEGFPLNDIEVVCENQFIINRLIQKYDVPTIPLIIPEEIINNLKYLVQKADNMQSIDVLHKKFEEMCKKTMNKNSFENFKHGFIFYKNLKNMTILDTTVFIKKNIIDKCLYYINIQKIINNLMKEYTRKGGCVSFGSKVSNIEMIQQNCKTQDNDAVYKVMFSQQRHVSVFSKVICCMSQSNLLELPIWNETQLGYINSIGTAFDDRNRNPYFTRKTDGADSVQKEEIQKNLSIIRQNVLTRCNVVFPLYFENNFFIRIKKYHYWKEGCNNSLIYNKIKNIFGNASNSFLICSEAFSKNQGWINGGLDMAHDILKQL
jgi:hypothetical protein